MYSPDEEQEYLVQRSRARRRAHARGLAKGKLSFFLRGEKLKGSFALVRTLHAQAVAAAEAQGPLRATPATCWLDAAAPCSPARRSTSCRSSRRGARSMRSASRADRPAGAAAEEARADARRSQRRARSHRASWLYEPKIDGYRVIAFVEKAATVRLTSRRGIDLTAVLPGNRRGPRHAGRRLDGARWRDRRARRGRAPVVQRAAESRAAQNRARDRRGAARIARDPGVLRPAAFRRPQSARRAVQRSAPLSRAVPAAVGAHLSSCTCPHDAEKLYAAASRAASKASSPSARTALISPASARRLAQDQSDADRGVRGRRLHERARARASRWARCCSATGRAASCTTPATWARASTEAIVADLHEALRALARKRLPFAEKPPLHRPTTWLEPEVVVEVTFSDWTPDGMLRAPVFLRVRDDIAPRTTSRTSRERAARRRIAALDALAAQARRPRSKPRRNGTSRRQPRVSETPSTDIATSSSSSTARPSSSTLAVGDANIRLTNLDREYWPADPRHQAPGDHQARSHPLSRGGLALHAAAPARPAAHHDPHARRHRRRALLPEALGRSAPRFVETITVFSEHKDEQHAYILANNLPTLLWLGQNGTLEFHVWHSRANVAPDAASQSTDYASEPRSARSLRAQLPGLPGVRHRPVHLLRQGGEGRRARAEQEGLRRRPERGLLAARPAEGDVPRRHREDLRQDRPACLRADRAHRHLR